jgi:hypothetical protein
MLEMIDNSSMEFGGRLLNGVATKHMHSQSWPAIPTGLSADGGLVSGFSDCG